MEDEIRLIILNFLNQNSTKYINSLYRIIIKNPNYIKTIDNYLGEEFKNFKLNQKIYHFYFQNKEIKKCRNCGLKLKFNTFGNPYQEFCSKDCSGKWYSINKEIINIKRKKTNLDKYGVEFVMQVPEIQSKLKNNNLEKHGVENCAKLDSVKLKISHKFKTILKDNPNFYKERYQKFLNSIRKKYEVQNSIFELKYFQEKRIKTLRNNFNNFTLNSPFQIPSIQQKIKNTNLELYGFENVMSNDIIQRKNFISSVALKRIEIENKIFITQGDGVLILPFLVEEFGVENIKTEFENPKFKYIFQGKNKTYRPDFFIEKENLIIEVKSVYFLKNNLEKNILKFNKVLDNNYKFKLFLTTHQKDIIIFDINEPIKNNIIKSINYDFDLNQNIIFYKNKYNFILFKNLPKSNNGYISYVKK